MRDAIKHSTAATATSTATPAARRRPVCRHCQGSALEPGPFRLEFDRAGENRGEQAKLAEATGISVSMLSLIADGARLPSIVTLVLLARALNTTVDQIISSPKIRARIQSELRDRLPE